MEAEGLKRGKSESLKWLFIALALIFMGLFFVSILLLRHWPEECASHVSWDEEDVNI